MKLFFVILMTASGVALATPEKDACMTGSFEACNEILRKANHKSGEFESLHKEICASQNLKLKCSERMVPAADGDKAMRAWSRKDGKSSFHAVSKGDKTTVYRLTPAQ